MESVVSRFLDHASRALFLLCAMHLLSACASPPPKPTVIMASVNAAADVNPDRKERASPVIVRLFELKTVAAFDSADFFSLWDRESQSLGGELVAREELHLRPGEHRTFERTLQPETQYVAVVAAFRDLEHAQWRGSLAVVPHEKQTITIRLESRAIIISQK
jgi:type VI secretion system protein VasD